MREKLYIFLALVIFVLFMSFRTQVLQWPVNISYYLADQDIELEALNTVNLKDYKRPDSVEIKISLPYENGEALIDLGKYLGHLPSAVSGTSCFGTCHNVAKGGHPDDILPVGGGEWRRIKNELYKKWVDADINLPFDKPAVDSPGFVDNCLDTTILWSAVSSDFPFEEQGRRGIDAHDETALALMAENDYLARRLHIQAYGHDTITSATVICAFSAYEQTIVSNESNISQGIVTRPKGLKLFDTHCQSCHSANIPSPSNLALSGEKRGIDLVKTPKLTGFMLAPHALFSTAENVSISKDIVWEAIKQHKGVYPQLDEITYGESRSIAAWMSKDYTDHNLERYK